AALRLVEQNAITLYLSKPILGEVRRALNYPEIRRRNSHVTDQRIGDFLARISFRGVLLRRVPHVITFARDSRDEPYLDLALAIRADYLVTRDADLLSIGIGHAAADKELRGRFRRIAIVTPTDFLRELSQRGINS
ncbi:MAG TPA: putative toxin-antitoxin system toxin component, PIN family, partial [Tepidisphaeraceae bacterium]|nr:putative toxin-antitoxin system toxin component, PIN family [Tepidisphaeraceae bacterium]